jgi:flagellar biosynthesis chaperone FliJ
VAFRFRAAAALDVRRKQEDAARLVAAEAETARETARQRAEDARSAALADGERLVAAQSAGVEAWRVQWHRAWIEQQRREAIARAGEAEKRTAEAAVAQRAVQEAFKRRRVLERLRDRASRKFRRAADQQHVREMNELATLRFVAQIAEGEHRAD